MVVEDVVVSLCGGAPWGFRLQGGVEHQRPLQVAKVRLATCVCVCVVLCCVVVLLWSGLGLMCVCVCVCVCVYVFASEMFVGQ